MSMSRKHYREVAEIIRVAVNHAETYDGTSTARMIADEMASMFKRDNGLFDRDRFMTACGF